MPDWPARLLEVIWLVIGAFGLRAAISNLRNATDDASALYDPDLPPRPDLAALKLVAQGHIRRQVARSEVLLLFLILGLVALATPAPVRPQLTFAGLVTSFILILAEVSLTTESLRDHRDRVRLEELLDRLANTTVVILKEEVGGVEIDG